MKQNKFTKKIISIPVFTGILLIGTFGLSNINNNKYVNNLISNPETVFDLDNNNGQHITQLSVGGNHSSALTNKGNVYTWGNNYEGQLGDGSNDNKDTPTRVTDNFKLTEGEDITQLSMGGYHSSALTNKGNVYTWGKNYQGQLGDGSINHKDTPTKITDKFKLTEGEHIMQLNMGKNHSYALTNKGNVYTWGDNSFGQLGNGTKANKATPIKITNNFSLAEGEHITQLNLDTSHSSALTNKGNVYTWGDNSFGQLGIGHNSTDFKHTTPQKITSNFELIEGDEQIEELNLGKYHSSALTNKGNVYTWGTNGSGQLGDGSMGQYKPTKITDNFHLPLTEQIIQLSMGDQHSAALTNKGNVYTWGLNDDGQLGDDSTEIKQTPIYITGKFGFNSSEHITHLNLGIHHSSALTNKGNVYTWGDNSFNQLGRLGEKKVPEKVYFSNYTLNQMVTHITVNSVTINFDLVTFSKNDSTKVSIWNNEQEIISKWYTSSGNHSIKLNNLKSNEEYNLLISVDNGPKQLIGLFTTKKYTSNHIEQDFNIKIKNKINIKDLDKEITLIYLYNQKKINGTGHHIITYKDQSKQTIYSSNDKYSVNKTIEKTHSLDQSLKNIEKIETIYKVDGYDVFLDSYTGTAEKVLGIIKNGLSAGAITGIVLGSITGVALIIIIMMYFLAKKNKSKT